MTSDDRNPSDVALGRKLRLLRRLCELRLRDVEKETHISQSLLSAYELGRRKPPLSKLGELIDFYADRVPSDFEKLMPSDFRVQIQAEIRAQDQLRERQAAGEQQLRLSLVGHDS